MVAAIVIGLMGVVPGMPNLIFLSVATLLGVLAYFRVQANAQPVVEEVEEFDQAKPDTLDLSWEDVNQVDEISLEVGYR